MPDFSGSIGKKYWGRLGANREKCAELTKALHTYARNGDLEGIKAIIDGGYDYLHGLVEAFNICIAYDGRVWDRDSGKMLDRSSPEGLQNNEAILDYFLSLEVLRDLAICEPSSILGFLGDNHRGLYESNIDTAAKHGRKNLLLKFIRLDAAAVAKSGALYLAQEISYREENTPSLPLGCEKSTAMVTMLLNETNIVENYHDTVTTIGRGILNPSPRRKQIFDEIMAKIPFENDHAIISIVDVLTCTGDTTDTYVLSVFAKLLSDERALASVKREAIAGNSILVKFASAGYLEVVDVLLQIPEVLQAFKLNSENVIATVQNSKPPADVAYLRPEDWPNRIALVVHRLKQEWPSHRMPGPKI